MWVGNSELEGLVDTFNKMRLKYLQLYGVDITHDKDALQQFFLHVMKIGFNYGYAAKTLEERNKDAGNSSSTG